MIPGITSCANITEGSPTAPVENDQTTVISKEEVVNNFMDMQYQIPVIGYNSVMASYKNKKEQFFKGNLPTGILGYLKKDFDSDGNDELFVTRLKDKPEKKHILSDRDNNSAFLYFTVEMYEFSDKSLFLSDSFTLTSTRYIYAYASCYSFLYNGKMYFAQEHNEHPYFTDDMEVGFDVLYYDGNHFNLIDNVVCRDNIETINFTNIYNTLHKYGVATNSINFYKSERIHPFFNFKTMISKISYSPNVSRKSYNFENGQTIFIRTNIKTQED